MTDDMTDEVDTAAHDGERDDAWLEQFLADELPRAWSVAGAVCTDAHDAEEVTAEACANFVVAYRDGRLDDHPEPSLYLLRSVRNGAIDLHRRRSRPAVDHRVHPERLTPEDHIENVADGAAITRAYSRLSLRFQECLRLVTIEGETMEGAGRILGLNANAMRQLTHRARHRLRRYYVEEMSGTPIGRECASVVAALASGQELAVHHEQHLHECETCSEARDDLRAAGLWRAVPVPVALAATVTADLGGASSGGSRAPRADGGRVLAAACAAAIAVAALGAFGWSEIRSNSEAASAAPTADGVSPRSLAANAGSDRRPTPIDRLAALVVSATTSPASSADDRRGGALGDPEVLDPDATGRVGTTAAPRGATAPDPRPTPIAPTDSPGLRAPPPQAGDAPESDDPPADRHLVAVAVETPAGTVGVDIPVLDPLPPLAEIEISTEDDPIAVEVLGTEIIPGGSGLRP